MKKNPKKKVFLSLGAITAVVAIPVVTVVSCGERDNGTNIMLGGHDTDQDGVSLKLIEENIVKENAKIWENISFSPKQANGDSSLITKLKDKSLFNNTVADPNFVKRSNGVFQRSPRTIISGSANLSGEKTKLDTNNLNYEAFGFTDLHDYVVTQNKGTLNLSLISGTEDDSTGTLGVKATITVPGYQQVVKEYKVLGFTVTKDIKLDGNSFGSISDIIDALNKKTDMDFEKKVAIMTPQDLKNELIDLYNKTYGGRLTIIGTYNGQTSAIALDRHTMLLNLIQAFGDVSKTKRYFGTWVDLGTSLVLHPGKVQVGNLVKLFAEYRHDLPGDDDKNDVAGLLGNLPPQVMNMFPDLLKLFSSVANGVKTMSMVSDWASNTINPKTNKPFTDQIINLDHILVQWVLKTGSWK